MMGKFKKLVEINASPQYDTDKHLFTLTDPIDRDKAHRAGMSDRDIDEALFEGNQDRMSALRIETFA